MTDEDLQKVLQETKLKPKMQPVLESIKKYIVQIKKTLNLELAESILAQII